MCRFEGPALPRPLRVAIVPTPEGPAVDPSVSEAVRKAGASLSDAGYEVDEVSPPDLSRTAELWHELAMPDVFKTLLPLMYRFGDEDSQRSMQLWVDAHPQVDIDGFLARQVERDALITRWAAFFEDYPIVVLPSSGEPPLPVDLDMAGEEGSARGISREPIPARDCIAGVAGPVYPCWRGPRPADGSPTCRSTLPRRSTAWTPAK